MKSVPVQKRYASRLFDCMGRWEKKCKENLNFIFTLSKSCIHSQQSLEFLNDDLFTFFYNQSILSELSCLGNLFVMSFVDPA